MQEKTTCRFPFLGALDIAGFQEAANRLLQGLYPFMLKVKQSRASTNGPVVLHFLAKEETTSMLIKTNGAYIESISISPQLTQNCYITPCPYILLHSLKDALQRKQ